MSKIEVTEANWLSVSQGRLVLLRAGAQKGRLCAIVGIISQSRVLVDGPSSDESKAVPRQAVHVNDITLTPILIEKLPRDAGTGALRKLWEKQEIDNKISQSTFTKKREQQERRSNLSDFERFKVMRLKKQVRYEVQKTAAKVKAAA